MATIQASINGELLDAVARQKLGALTSGVSTGPGWSTIHTFSEGAETDAALILAQWGSVSLAASASVITADGVDASSITLSASADVDWLIVDELGDVVGNGTASPVAGTVTLSFAVDVAGTYTICVIDGFSTGFVEVEAQ